MRDRRITGERGFALLVVLWTLVLVSLLVTHIGVIGRGEAQIATNLRAGAQREALVDGAVFEAAFRALDRGGRHWDADGAQHRLDRGGVPIAVRIEDTSNKANLNTATPALLRALLVEIGLEPPPAGRLAEAIVGWRGEGGSIAARAAMLEQYAATRMEYGPPQTRFHDVDELALVIGMTPEILARLKPHMTIWSGYGPGVTSTDPVVREAVARGAQEGGDLPDDQDYDGSVTLEITATALSATGSGFTRYAVLRFDLNDISHPCRILAWDGG